MQGTFLLVNSSNIDTRMQYLATGFILPSVLSFSSTDVRKVLNLVSNVTLKAKKGRTVRLIHQWREDCQLMPWG